MCQSNAIVLEHMLINSGKIEIKPIDTNVQQAGIFTKLLPLAQFRYLRKLIRDGKHDDVNRAHK